MSKSLKSIKKAVIAFVAITIAVAANAQQKSMRQSFPENHTGDYLYTNNYWSKGKTLKTVVVPVNFSDYALTYTQAQIDSAFNGVNYTAHGFKGSVRDYYSDMSGGKFIPQFEVLPPYTASQGRNGYGTSGGALTEEVKSYVNMLLRERALDEFDSDNNGYIDHISIIFAGHGYELTGATGQIYSHHAPALTLYKSLGNVYYDHYSNYEISYVSEIDNFENQLGIATYCRVFGNVLGLPDLYDADGTTDGQAEHPAVHDLMSYHNTTGHPVALSAFLRYALGWLNLKTVGTAASITLPDIADEKQALRINTTTTGEFFVIENRQNSKWNIPNVYEGHGLLVFRVDSAWYNSHCKGVGISGLGNSVSWGNRNEVNAYASHLGYALIAADNNMASNYTTDFFPAGAVSFTDATTPSMKSLVGANTGKPITNITETGGNIYFNLSGGGNTLIVSTRSVTVAGSGKVRVEADVLPCGTENVTERGVCYGLLPTPSVSGNKVTDTSGNNSFSAEIAGLNAETTYYFRAYAKSSSGTAVYGTAQQFTTENVLKITSEYTVALTDLQTVGEYSEGHHELLADISEMQNPVMEIYFGNNVANNYQISVLPEMYGNRQNHTPTDIANSVNGKAKYTFELSNKSDYYRIIFPNTLAMEEYYVNKDSVVIKEQTPAVYAALPYSEKHLENLVGNDYPLPKNTAMMWHINTLSAVSPVLHLKGINTGQPNSCITVKYKTDNGNYQYLNIVNPDEIPYRKAPHLCSYIQYDSVYLRKQGENYVEDNIRVAIPKGDYYAQLPQSEHLTLLIEGAAVAYAYDNATGNPFTPTYETVAYDALNPIKILDYSNDTLLLRVWFDTGIADIQAQGICWGTSSEPTIGNSSDYVEGAGQAFRDFHVHISSETYIRLFTMTGSQMLYGNDFHVYFQNTSSPCQTQTFLDKTVTLPYRFHYETEVEYNNNYGSEEKCWKRNVAELYISYNYSIMGVTDLFKVNSPAAEDIANYPDTVFLQSMLINQQGANNPQVKITVYDETIVSGNSNSNQPVKLFAVNETTGAKTLIAALVPSRDFGQPLAFSTKNCGDNIRLRFEMPLLAKFALSQFEMEDSHEFLVNAPTVERQDAAKVKFVGSYQPNPQLPAVTEAGFVWSITGDPLNTNGELVGQRTAGVLSANNSIDVDITFSEIATFYVRTYVQNSGGYSYSALSTEHICGSYSVVASDLPFSDNRTDEQKECTYETTANGYTFYSGNIQFYNRPAVNKIASEIEIVVMLADGITEYEQYINNFTCQYRVTNSDVWQSLPAEYSNIAFDRTGLIGLGATYFYAYYKATLQLPRNVEQLRLIAAETAGMTYFYSDRIGGINKIDYSLSSIADIGCVPPVIDVLTVDNNQLNVQWSISDLSNVTSVKIYRESSTAGSYTLMKTYQLSEISANTTFTYVDNTANSAQQAYRYRIVSVNSEGTEFAGTEHKSVHLSINKGIENQWNLYWTQYVGLDVATVKIYRGSSPSNMAYLDEVAGTNNTYTDISAPEGTNYYVVETVFAGAQSAPSLPRASQRASQAATSSRSNVVSNSSVSINEVTGEGQISIYPNPVKFELKIENAELKIGETVVIYDITGKITVNCQLSTVNSIDVSHLSSGVYFLKIGNKTAKFVKE